MISQHKKENKKELRYHTNVDGGRRRVLPQNELLGERRLKTRIRTKKAKANADVTPDH